MGVYFQEERNCPEEPPVVQDAVQRYEPESGEPDTETGKQDAED